MELQWSTCGGQWATQWRCSLLLPLYEFQRSNKVYLGYTVSTLASEKSYLSHCS